MESWKDLWFSIKICTHWKRSQFDINLQKWTPVTAEMNKIQTICTERHIIPYTIKYKVLISSKNCHSLLPASTPLRIWEGWGSTLH